MKESVYAALRPVKGRQQRALMLRAAGYGFVLAALAGYGLGVGRAFLGWSVSWQAAVLALGAGPILGVLIGLALRRSWKGAASAVDAHYRLKDRSVTALEFLHKPDAGEVHALQIADAAEHLRQIDPKQVVPFRAPRSLPVGVAACALAAVGLFWPLQVASVEAARPNPASEKIVNEAQRIADSLANLEEVAKEDESRELAAVVEQIKAKAEEMKQDGVDEREALAKLSEMQAAVQSLLAQFNQAVMDGQLQSLGSALAAATAYEGAGRALQEAKLEKASQELEKLEDPKLTPKEAKALEEKLKQVAKQAGAAGLGALSNASAELAEGLKKGGKGGAGKANKKLAKVVDKVVRRKRVNTLLTNALDNFAESKSNLQADFAAVFRRPERSKSPSSNWGKGISGNVNGPKTKLGANRNQTELTGTPSDNGESDVETSSSPEGREQSGRAYKDRYRKYSKESDAVLEGEAIPLGQRQMIRKYFESIRPQNAESPDKP